MKTILQTIKMDEATKSLFWMLGYNVSVFRNTDDLWKAYLGGNSAMRKHGGVVVMSKLGYDHLVAAALEEVMK